MVKALNIAVATFLLRETVRLLSGSQSMTLWIQFGFLWLWNLVIQVQYNFLWLDKIAIIRCQHTALCVGPEEGLKDAENVGKNGNKGKSDKDNLGTESTVGRGKKSETKEHKKSENNQTIATTTTSTTTTEEKWNQPNPEEWKQPYNLIW